MRLTKPVTPLAFAIAALLAKPARAEVHFGAGVRIFGHDFSHRTYGSVHIRRVR